MATLTFTVPDADLTRIANALCTAAGLPVTPTNLRTAVTTNPAVTVS